MRTADGAQRDIVIGVGNPLMGDDGLGIVAVARLAERWGDNSDLTFLDGGTWGMNLLPIIEAAERLLILDAIDRGLAPGTRIELSRDEIPRYFALKLSPHQLDLREVLALAELRGTLPTETVALGLQPERVELTLELSPALTCELDRLLTEADALLESWGHMRAASAKEA